MSDRLPPLAPEAMSEEQKGATGVRGPFIALLRSPELMRRLQKVGEYVRFQSALEPRISEFAMLIVARHLTQQFEWQVHYPLAIEAGLARQTADALAQGARPRGMAGDEALVHDFCVELLCHHGVAEATYESARTLLGERALVELVALVGYFVTVSLVLNVAHTPAEKSGSEPDFRQRMVNGNRALTPIFAAPLEPFPR